MPVYFRCADALRGRILTLPPIGVPRSRGFLEQGSPDRLKAELQTDRLKAELRTGPALGLRRGQCQDAPRAGEAAIFELPFVSLTQEGTIATISNNQRAPMHSKICSTFPPKAQNRAPSRHQPFPALAL